MLEIFGFSIQVSVATPAPASVYLEEFPQTQISGMGKGGGMEVWGHKTQRFWVKVGVEFPMNLERKGSFPMIMIYRLLEEDVEVFQ